MYRPLDRVDNAQISQISKTDRHTDRQSDFLGFLSKLKSETRPMN